MAKARVAKVLGTTDTVSLPNVFEEPFNGPLVHECAIADLASRRQGTHATKTRGMVSGGGGKPWRQKGTGRARAGSDRSPIWTGGGTVFGPTPRHYTVKVNRKARRTALRCALSVHAERESLAVLDPSAFDAPSTKKARDLIADYGDRSVLVVLVDGEESVAKSFRNLKNAVVLHSADAAVVDIVRASALVFSRAALEDLAGRASKSERKAVSA